MMEFKPFSKAVLAFFHADEGSKIPTVKFHQYTVSLMFISLLYSNNQKAEEILLNSFHRMDGINYRFKVESKSSKKKKREKHFEISVLWPSDGKFLRQTRVTTILTKRKKPPSFWEHRYKNGKKANKWMSLPVTGKLKDMTDKKNRKKDFPMADLVVTKEDIRSHTHKLLPMEKFDTLSVYVVESIKKNKDGKVKESKKIWLDAESYMIIKVELYTGSGRLYRTVECSDFHYIDKILFPMSIYVQDLKSKTDIKINVKDIELNPEFNMDIFIPKDQ